MKVINPNLSTNILKILPRSFDPSVETKVYLTEEGTNVKQEVSPIDSYFDSNYTVLECQFVGIREGYLYFIEIKQSSTTKEFNSNTGLWSTKEVPSSEPTTTLIYRDKAYATSLNVEEYSINEGEYQIDVDSDNSEYITYDN